MAYQKVGTPRFYIDFFETMKSYGWNHSKMQTKYNEQFEAGTLPTTGNLANFFQDDLFGLSNIETQKSIPPNTEFIINAHASLKDFLCVDTNNQVKIYGALLNFSVPPGGQIYLGYPVILGHNLQNTTYAEGGLNTDDIDVAWWHTKPGCVIAPQKLNWDIVHDFYDIIDMTIVGSIDSEFNYKDFEIGSFSIGQYYDMPLSPDLDLTMSIEYDGFTNIKTLSGHTITQANYQGSPWWYDINGNKVEPWSVGESTGTSKRNGRRVWKLKFSYMSDKDLFASNYGSSTYAEDVLPYESGDQDIPNLGANLLFDGDFNTDVSANTTPAGGRDSGTGWGTDSHTSLIDGTSTISGGLANLRQMSQAENEVVEGEYELTSSITSTAGNWRLYQNNVFKTSDDSLSDLDNNRNKKIIYRVSFRAKYVDVDNAGDFLQLGAGYHMFFKQPMTSTFENYEVEFAFDDTPSDDNNLSSNFADAWNHSSAHKLTIGSFPAVNQHTTGWENHFQIEWIKVQQHNPSDFTYNIDNDDSFSAQVLNKISHGEKFIFQPDNTSNNPSDFAICVLDGDSFEMKRTAWNVYDIEMTIREVW